MLCIYEDLSSIPSKKPGQVIVTCNPSFGEEATARSMGHTDQSTFVCLVRLSKEGGWLLRLTSVLHPFPQMNTHLHTSLYRQMLKYTYFHTVHTHTHTHTEVVVKKRGTHECVECF